MLSTAFVMPSMHVATGIACDKQEDYGIAEVSPHRLFRLAGRSRTLSRWQPAEAINGMNEPRMRDKTKRDPRLRQPTPVCVVRRNDLPPATAIVILDTALDWAADLPAQRAV